LLHSNTTVKSYTNLDVAVRAKDLWGINVGIGKGDRVTSWKREEDGRKKEGGQWYEVELRGEKERPHSGYFFCKRNQHADYMKSF